MSAPDRAAVEAAAHALGYTLQERPDGRYALILRGKTALASPAFALADHRVWLEEQARTRLAEHSAALEAAEAGIRQCDKALRALGVTP